MMVWLGQFLEIFSAMNSIGHFLHIYLLNFPLEEIFLQSNSIKIQGVPPRIIFLKIKMTFTTLCNLGFWILTTWPFHSYTLAYYRPIHLINTEFQSIDNNPSTLLINFFFPFNCYNHVDTLIEIYSTNY
jgi:hypothetical protein